MVNRVLIRIKVVQMLYSYLLTRSDFRIAQLPSDASRDRIYAQRIYQNLLLLIPAISGLNVSGRDGGEPFIKTPNRWFFNSPMVRALASNQELRQGADSFGIEAFEPVAQDLLREVTNSAVYRSYVRRREREETDDVALWTTVLSTIFAVDKNLEAIARRDKDFTLRGYNMAFEMAEDTLRSYGSTRAVYSQACRDLEKSLTQAYNLYHSLLWLSVEITRALDLRLDENRNRVFATPEDLNPNLKMVDNLFVKAIAESPEMESWQREHPLSWENDPLLVRNLLDTILRSELYANYMSTPGNDIREDAEFWRHVYRDIIFPGDELAETLEAESIFWNDDLHIMGTFVLKTVKQFQNAGELKLLPQYKDEEDARFGAELFLDTIKNERTYRGYIDHFIDEGQWDPERLAFMDIIVMETAIAEMLNFPSIPVAVTVNEYIEIAKAYSTPQSSGFINGILRSIIDYLKEEGILKK